jgi:hypothetical protein
MKINKVVEKRLDIKVQSFLFYAKLKIGMTLKLLERKSL